MAPQEYKVLKDQPGRRATKALVDLKDLVEDRKGLKV
jgi:hypothetical protein